MVFKRRKVSISNGWTDGSIGQSSTESESRTSITTDSTKWSATTSPTLRKRSKCLCSEHLATLKFPVDDVPLFPQSSCVSDEDSRSQPSEQENMKYSEEKQNDAYLSKVDSVYQLIQVHCNKFLWDLDCSEAFIEEMEQGAKRCLVEFLRRSQYKPGHRKLAQMSALAAACVYASARDREYPFTIAELACAFEIPLKTITRFVFDFNRHKVGEKTLSEAVDFVPRYVNHLNLPDIVLIKANLLCKEWSGHNVSLEPLRPPLVAAGSIIVVSRLIKDVPNYKEEKISKIFKLSKAGLKKMTRSLTTFVDTMFLNNAAMYAEFWYHL